jgi:hypothetical protein
MVVGMVVMVLMFMVMIMGVVMNNSISGSRSRR